MPFAWLSAVITAVPVGVWYLILLLAVILVWFVLVKPTIWGFPYGEQIVGTVTAVDAFLGTCLGISTKEYWNGEDDH